MRTHRQVLSILAIVGATVVATTTVQAVAEEGPEPIALAAPPIAADTGDGITESAFVPVTPCRLYDSRKIGSGPTIPSGATRRVRVRNPDGGGQFAAQGGKAGGCGIPLSATSVEVSVTAVSPGGTGFLRVWAAGSSEPTATFLNYVGGFNPTNTGTVTICQLACTNGQDLAFRTNSAATHVVIDVQGYTVKPLAAVVSVNGALLNGSRAVAAARPSVGQYLVTFDRAVDRCVAAADVDGTTGIASASIGYDASNEEKMYVFTTDANGVLVNRGFHLTVTC